MYDTIHLRVDTFQSTWLGSKFQELDASNAEQPASPSFPFPSASSIDYAQDMPRILSLITSRESERVPSSKSLRFLQQQRFLEWLA